MKDRIRRLYPSAGDFEKEMKRIGVDPYALNIFQQKIETLLIKIDACRIEAANIIKQDALSVGADCVLPRSAISGRPDKTDIIVIGTQRTLEKLSGKLKEQPFGLKEVAEALISPLEPPRMIRARDKVLDLSSPVIMGILNRTPDSFYDGGYYGEQQELEKRVESMLEEGSRIIDIGGESTRPGSREVSPDDEWERIEGALTLVRRLDSEILISVDTRKSEVARRSLDAGADMINDVSALTSDASMAESVASAHSAVILMHMKGTPETMQKEPSYEDLMAEIFAFLKERSEAALRAGILGESVLIDPGIGFGKRTEDNAEIIRRLRELKSLGYPVVMGLSRKSFIGRLTGKDPEDRLWGTIAAHTLSLINGADVIRAHDVAAARQTLEIVEGVLNEKKE